VLTLYGLPELHFDRLKESLAGACSWRLRIPRSVSRIPLGGMDGALFGRYRGTSQSRLSRMLNPPRKLPYVRPTILWLIGFFMLMSFDAQGKLSWVLGMLSVAYLFLLPAYLLASLFYNFFVRPAKHRRWKEKLMCQRCGAMIENESSRGADAQVRA
jgi:hypothetical protein